MPLNASVFYGFSFLPSCFLAFFFNQCFKLVNIVKAQFVHSDQYRGDEIKFFFASVMIGA